MHFCFDANNEFHSDTGPAVILADNDWAWYSHGKFHRVGGPAVLFPNGIKWWYVNDKRHRIDGPAVEHPNTTLNEWWYNGEYIECSSQDEFLRIIKITEYW